MSAPPQPKGSHALLLTQARDDVERLAAGIEMGQGARPGLFLGGGSDIDVAALDGPLQGFESGAPLFVQFPFLLQVLEALEQAVDAASACDVMVFSGGSSVGDRDLMLDVIAARGEILFHGKIGRAHV